MAIYHPPITELALDVSPRLVAGVPVYNQKIHRIDLRLNVGGPSVQGLDVYLSGYARNADGSCGERLPIEARLVPLDALPTRAVGLDGTPRYLLLLSTGRVQNAVTGEVFDLPAGQTWLRFLDELPETLLLQNEAMAAKRDKDKVCVRGFAEQQVLAADRAPSSFA